MAGRAWVDPGTAIVVYFASCVAGAAVCLQSVWNAARNGVLVTPATHLYLDSDVGLLLLINLCISSYAFVAWLTAVVSFGSLTTQESNALWHRLAKYMTFKLTVTTALAIVDLPSFGFCICWYAVAVYVQLFLGVAKDRLDSLGANPLVSHQQQLRPFSLVLLLGAVNCGAAAMMWSWREHLVGSQLLLLGYEAALSAVDSAATAARYSAHLVEQMLEAPVCCKDHAWWTVWAAKAWQEHSRGVMYYLQLVGDLAVQSLSLIHYTHVLLMYGLNSYLASFLLLMDIKSTSQTMLQRLRQHWTFMAATQRLNEVCAAVSCEVTAGEDCAICRDSLTGARQLQCGHTFHLSCLRAWLQQCGPANFCCPICRRRMLDTQGPPQQEDAHANNALRGRSSRHTHDSSPAAAGRSLAEAHHRRVLGGDDPSNSAAADRPQQVLDDHAYALLLQQQEELLYEQEQQELQHVQQLLAQELQGADGGRPAVLATGGGHKAGALSWLLQRFMPAAGPASAHPASLQQQQ